MMIIDIDVPPFHSAERIYTIDVIFGVILGIDYRLRISQSSNYVLTLPNGFKISFADHFWIKYPNDYLSADNIPKSIRWMSNRFTQQKLVPILFGDDVLIQNDIGVHCNADLFASAFFMLSRWEETVQANECDTYGRFLSNKSVAVRHNFITQPIVNVYASIIKHIIESQLYTITLKSSFKTVFSVDVDYAMRFLHVTSCVRAVAAALLKHRSINMAGKHLKNYILGADEYNTYLQIIDIARQNNASLQWYLLCTDENIRFWNKNKALLQFLQSTDSVGLHPSIAASVDAAILKSEKQSLEQLVNQSITKSRFHFLAGQSPLSWHILADLGITSDSSLYYTSSPGFRTGCCTPHPLFSVNRKAVLPVTEYPLMAMDASLLHGDASKIASDFAVIKRECELYNGTFTFLWHNSSFSGHWAQHKSVLNNLL